MKVTYGEESFLRADEFACGDCARNEHGRILIATNKYELGNARMFVELTTGFVYSFMNSAELVKVDAFVTVGKDDDNNA